jgi:DNA-binding transcriptional regulator PaaX
MREAEAKGVGDDAQRLALRWLLLVYRVPGEPTRLRAAVWRRLKSIGAIYLQNSVAALPVTVGGERALRALRNEIVEQMGGSAQLLIAQTLVGDAEIIDAFNNARDEEYNEIVQRCQDFLRSVQENIDGKHYTYAALEEHDNGLTKLRRWADKVRARDTLGAAGAADADDMIGQCAQALNDYAERVYQFDSATTMVVRVPRTQGS